MIELYKMYLRLHWKMVLIIPGLVLFRILIELVKRGFDFNEDFIGSTEMSGFFALVNGMVFYYSLALANSREMGIETISCLPISRKEVAYVRYLLPLTAQALLGGVCLIYPIIHFNGEAFIRVFQSSFQCLVAGILLLAINYTLSNHFESMQKKVKWVQIVMVIVTVMLFLAREEFPILDATELLFLVIVSGGVVAYEIYSFQNNRTFQI